MPRENSLSDSEGRSLTPDIESDAGSDMMDIPAPVSPTYGPGQRPLFPPVIEPHAERIIALAVHPGAVATEIQEQIKEAFGAALGTVLMTLQRPLLRNVDEGSLGTLWAAVSPDVEKMDLQGVYISDPGVVGGETAQAKDPRGNRS